MVRCTCCTRLSVLSLQTHESLWGTTAPVADRDYYIVDEHLWNTISWECEDDWAICHPSANDVVAAYLHQPQVGDNCALWRHDCSYHWQIDTFAFMTRIIIRSCSSGTLVRRHRGASCAGVMRAVSRTQFFSPSIYSYRAVPRRAEADLLELRRQDDLVVLFGRHSQAATRSLQLWYRENAKSNWHHLDSLNTWKQLKPAFVCLREDW